MSGSFQTAAVLLRITTTMETQLPGKVGPIILPHGGTVGGGSLIRMTKTMVPIRDGGTESGLETGRGRARPIELIL